MSPEDLGYALSLGYAGIFGLCFGSFMNVCIARMPEDRSVVSPASACPRCGSAIRWHDNVPVLSWLWLGGRCRACRGRISGLYPAVELLFGVLTMLLFRHIIPDAGAIDLPHVMAFGWYLYLLFALVALTFIDLKHYIIPDPFSIYAVPFAVGGAWLLGVLGYQGAPSWRESVVGALFAGSMLIPLMGLYRLIRKEQGMGWGDPKLLALIGAYFGAIPASPFVLITGATVGSIIGIAAALAQGKGLRLQMPFGPFLALGAIIWLFFGEKMGVRFF